MENFYEMEQEIFGENPQSETPKNLSLGQRLKTDKITLSVFIITLVLTLALVLIGIIVPLAGRYKTISANGRPKTVSVSYANSVPNSMKIPEKKNASSYNLDSYEVLKLEPKTYGEYIINAQEERGRSIAIAVYKVYRYGSDYGEPDYLVLNLVDAGEKTTAPGETAVLEIELYNEEYYICIFGTASGSAEVWVNPLSD